MTVRGLFCVILEALLLVLGLGTGYRAILMAAFCLGLVLLVALLSMVAVLLSTRADGSVDREEVRRGDTVTYTLQVRGLVLLPVAGYLTIRAPGKEKWEREFLNRHSLLWLPSFRWQRQVTIELPCPHQGHWQVGAESMWYEDLFGLFRIHLLGIAKRRLRRHLTVLPHVHELTSTAYNTANTAGFASTQMRSAASGELLGDTRLYQPGDPLKRIHWKLTARTREVYTRQFESQENSQVLLLMDLQCRSKRRQSTADIAVETVLSLLTYYVENTMSVRLLPVRAPRETTLQERRVVSAGEVQDVQSRLLSHRFTTEATPLEVWQLQDSNFCSAGTVLVVTDNPSAQLLSDLDALAALGRSVVCLSPCVEVEPLTESGVVQPVLLSKPEEISEKVGACV
ncbi:MAG: DUF58 domain-containing protein [Clostridia bacterium]|nr:DUF58 domain-containing protein [Clostridia bacterium]